MRIKSKRALGLAGLMLWAAAFCGCGLDPDDWPDGKPKIDRLMFLNQSPQDPLGLQFGISFSDSDGDASAGVLHLSINERETAALSMAELFESQSPPLAADASEGDFEVVVRLGEEIELGEVLRIGFAIEDGENKRSNEPWIEVRAIVPGGS